MVRVFRVWVWVSRAVRNVVISISICLPEDWRHMADSS